MSKNSQLLKRIHYLLHQKEKRAARRLLAALLQESPQDDSVWKKYVDTFGSPTERKRAYTQWLRAMPNNAHAVYGMAHNEHMSEPPERSVWLDNRFGWAYLATIIVLGFSALGIMAATLPSQSSLQSDINLLQQTNYDLNDNYSILKTDRDDLLAANKILIEEYDTLQVTQYGVELSYDSLMAEFDEAVADRDALWQEKEEVVYVLNETAVQLIALQNSHNQTVANLQYAQTQRNNLQANLNQVQASFDVLAETAVQPPYIIPHDQQIEVVFRKKEDNSIANLQIAFTGLNQRGQGGRPESSFLTIQLPNNRTQQIIDFRPFIELEPFRSGIRELYMIAADDEAFIREVWHMVTLFTASSANINGTPRLPLDTLLARSGSGADTAVLFSSLILAAPVRWDVNLIYIDRNHSGNPQTANHLLVQINTGARIFTIDTTQPDKMEPYSNVVGWIFDVN